MTKLNETTESEREREKEETTRAILARSLFLSTQEHLLFYFVKQRK